MMLQLPQPIIRASLSWKHVVDDLILSPRWKKHLKTMQLALTCQIGMNISYSGSTHIACKLNPSENVPSCAYSGISSEAADWVFESIPDLFYLLHLAALRERFFNHSKPNRPRWKMWRKWFHSWAYAPKRAANQQKFGQNMPDLASLWNKKSS